MEASKRISAIQENIGKVMIGSQTVVRLLLTAFIADGHVLIEDVPGMGKTVQPHPVHAGSAAQRRDRPQLF